MALGNKLGINDSAELARVEEKISKIKAIKLYERNIVDWNTVDKADYLLAMERSPVKDVEIKVLLRKALTEQIDNREMYMKGIDVSYYYEGYNTFKTEELYE